MDLDELFDALDVAGAGPCLVQLGRGLRGGKAVAGLFQWSTGRIAASVTAKAIAVTRRLGKTGDTLKVSHPELSALTRAARAWARRREAWAAFEERGSIFGGLSEQLYRAPGKAEAIRVWSRDKGGTKLRGADVPVVRGTPEAIDDGVLCIADLERTEPFVGPRPVKTGERYAVGPVTFDGWRTEARVRRGSEALWLEAGEEAFLEELAAAVELG